MIPAPAVGIKTNRCKIFALIRLQVVILVDERSDEMDQCQEEGAEAGHVGQCGMRLIASY